MAEKHTLLYAPDTGQIACALIQAGMGYQSREVLAHFDSREWLLHPGPRLVAVTDTMENWMQIAEMTPAQRIELLKDKV